MTVKPAAEKLLPIASTGNLNEICNPLGISDLTAHIPAIDTAPTTREQLLHAITQAEHDAGTFECQARQYDGKADAARQRAVELTRELVAMLPGGGENG